MAAMAAGAFDALAPKPRALLVPPEWSRGPARRDEQRDKAQTALALAFPGPSRADPSRYAASLLGVVASGLGGRFFEALRDRQSLAYTVIASPVVRPLAGQFIAYIATSPEKEEQARLGLLDEIGKLRDCPVTLDELERARTYALGTHAIRKESGGALMGDIADAWLFGALEELDEFDARVRALTAADLQDIAQRCFDVSRCVEGAVRGVAGRRV